MKLRSRHARPKNRTAAASSLSRGSREARRGGRTIPRPRLPERSFITLDDAQLLVACLAQLERADGKSHATFAAALRRLRLGRAVRRIDP
jgi:hypothetical protein